MGGLFGGGGGGQAPEGHFVQAPPLDIPNMNQLAQLAGSRLGAAAPWMNSGARTTDMGFGFNQFAPSAQMTPFNAGNQQANAQQDQQRGQQMGGLGQNYFAPGQQQMQQQNPFSGYFPMQPNANILPLFMSNYPMFPWSTPPWMQGITGSGGFSFGGQGNSPNGPGGQMFGGGQPPGGSNQGGGGSQNPVDGNQPGNAPTGSQPTGGGLPGRLPPRETPGPRQAPPQEPMGPLTSGGMTASGPFTGQYEAAVSPDQYWGVGGNPYAQMYIEGQPHRIPGTQIGPIQNRYWNGQTMVEGTYPG